MLLLYLLNLYALCFMLYDRGHKIENEIQYSSTTVSYKRATNNLYYYAKLKWIYGALFLLFYLFVGICLCRVFEVMNLSNTCGLVQVEWWF